MSYIGRGLQSGAFRQLDSIASSFNGSTTGFTMQVNSTNVIMGDVNQILLSLGGVIQKPGTDFTVSSSTLTFTTAPAANTSFFAILLGSDNGGTTTPTDLSVTTAKIVDANVTTAKITDANITKAKLADSIDVFAGTALSAADLGVGIHIKTADSSAATHTSVDELVLENNGHCGISILSATDATGNIYFNDSGGIARGYFEYNHDGDALSIGTSGSTQMTIASTGRVTIGGTSTSGDTLFNLYSVSHAQNAMAHVNSSDTGTIHNLRCINASGTLVGGITNDGSSTAFNTSSDYRLKENVETDWNATTRLKQLKPSRFNFIADADTTLDGFLAHEVSSIVPEAINGDKDATETKTNVVINADGHLIDEGITEAKWTAGKVEDEEGYTKYPTDSTWVASKVIPVYQGIDQSKLVPLMVKTIQELEARIKTLEDA
tara:strand:- start:1525 stop:2826 length:1302 start_codon:yes stop_codon:yes gene_type:complete